MGFTKRHAERLEKTATFLDNLPPKLFDFGVVCKVGENEPKEALAVGGGCGTVACVMGWTPAIFPRTFKWVGNGDEESEFRGIETQTNDGNSAIAEFFGLNYEEVSYLFYPFDGMFVGDEYVSNGLPPSASPKTVAAHIRKFVAWKQGLRSLP